jgi:hypothetical protein
VCILSRRSRGSDRAAAGVGRVGRVNCSYVSVRDRGRLLRDFAQASGRRGQGGERVDMVVVLGQGEVEKQIEKESNNINVQAIRQFLIRSRC